MTNALSKRGANRLAETIRKYWNSRGQSVSVWVEEGNGTEHTVRKPGGEFVEFYQVRSNLLNGLPIKKQLEKMAA